MNIPNIFLVVILASSSVKAMQTVDDAPRYCALLAEKLRSQPLFDGKGSIAEKSQVLPLESWDDSRIFSILNENLDKVTEKHFPCHSFGCGNYQLCDRDGNWIPQGIDFWLYDGYEYCSTDELKSHYKKIIEGLKSNWRPSTLAECPGILHKKSEDEWHLFIKETTLVEEDTLIRFLAHRLGLEEKISCFDYWIEEEKPYTSERLYIWVRKDALDDFDSRFRFRVNQVQTSKPSK